MNKEDREKIKTVCELRRELNKEINKDDDMSFIYKTIKEKLNEVKHKYTINETEENLQNLWDISMKISEQLQIIDGFKINKLVNLMDDLELDI